MPVHRWGLLVATTLLSVLGGVVAVPAAAQEAARGAPSRPIRWLAAGDSYSSGEGLPHATGACAQALAGSGSQTYAQFAATTLGSSYVEGGRPELVACTGAQMVNFFNAANDKPAQYADGVRKYDLVTFTFGGNDIQFSAVVQQCAAGKPLFMFVETDPGHICPKDSILRKRVDDLVPTYRRLVLDVAHRAVNRGGHIIVLGYPELIEDPDRWTGMPQAVDVCQGVIRADAQLLRGVAGHLNATIGALVGRVDQETYASDGVHVTFLDVNAKVFEPVNSTRHNLCSADSWINGLTKIDLPKGSFHPKQQAHDNEGSAVVAAISRLDWSGLETATASNPTTAACPTEEQFRRSIDQPSGDGRLVDLTCSGGWAAAFLAFPGAEEALVFILRLTGGTWRKVAEAVDSFEASSDVCRAAPEDIRTKFCLF